MSSLKIDSNNDPDIKSLEDDAKNTIIELRKRILDYLTLDVITIKGNFNTVFETPKLPENTDIVDFVKTKLETEGNTLTVLAQTHKQIDGDCLNAIPTEDVGKLSCKEIWDFHSKTVEDALQVRKERLELILDLIEIISNRKRTLFELPNQ